MGKALMVVVVVLVVGYLAFFIRNSLAEPKQKDVSPQSQTAEGPQINTLNCNGGPMEPMTPEISKRIAEIKEEQRPVAEIASSGEKRTAEQTNSLVQALMKVGGPKGFAAGTRYWADHTPANSPQCASLLPIMKYWDDLAAKKAQ